MGVYKMWKGEFSLCELLSLFDPNVYQRYIKSKHRRSLRRFGKTNKETRRSLQKNKSPRGWGECGREIENAVDEIRRLREY